MKKLTKEQSAWVVNKIKERPYIVIEGTDRDGLDVILTQVEKQIIEQCTEDSDEKIS